MYIAIFFLLVAITILIWDFRFSRASKALNQLKHSEPEVYATLYGKSVLPPSSSINGIIARGLYQNIKSKPLKDEILAINEKSQKYVLLPLLIPLNLISMAAGFYSNDEAQIIWPALILELIAFPIYQGALIFFLAAVIKDEHQNVSQYYRQSMKFWLPLLVLYLLMGLAIMGGCMLLILPGLIVAARVAFAEFYCLLHEEAPLDAFKSSWEQSREYQ